MKEVGSACAQLAGAANSPNQHNINGHQFSSTPDFDVCRDYYHGGHSGDRDQPV